MIDSVEFLLRQIVDGSGESVDLLGVAIAPYADMMKANGDGLRWPFKRYVRNDSGMDR